MAAASLANFCVSELPAKFGRAKRQGWSRAERSCRRTLRAVRQERCLGAVAFAPVGTLNIANGTVSCHSPIAARGHGEDILSASGPVTRTNSPLSGNLTSGGLGRIGNPSYARANSSLSGNFTSSGSAPHALQRLEPKRKIIECGDTNFEVTPCY